MTKIAQKDRHSSILKESQSNNEINLEKLAGKLSVSTRTVRNDINILNKELKGIAEFKIEKGNYWLKLYDEKRYKEFLVHNEIKKNSEDSLQKRNLSLAVRLLNASEPLKIDELADALNMGRTTLIMDLKRLRLTFEAYDLELRGKPNTGIRLMGSEWKKRIYILQNNIYCTELGDQHGEIMALIREFSNHFYIEEQTQEEWLRYIQVMIQRIKHKHALSWGNTPDFLTAVKDSVEFGRVSAFADRLENIYQNSFPVLERLFITLPILGRRSPVNMLDLASVPVSYSIKKLIANIQKQVSKELNISFSLEKVAKELGYHLMFMINRLVFGVQLHNSLVSEVRKKYPLAYEMAEIAYDVIYRDYHIKATDAELGYLAYYFGIMLNEQESRLRNIRHIGIVCDTGRSTARIIEVQLSKILPDQVQKKLFSSSSVTSNELNALDIVFSTVSLKIPVHTPVIHVADIFDERLLLKEINQLFEFKNLSLQTDEGHHSIIGSLLDRDKFFILDGHQSYHDSLKEMIDCLFDKNYVDDQFKQRIVEREMKGQMIFDNEIGFPHAINKKNNEIMLALGIFHKGIKVGQKIVRLIFLLGVPERNSDENLLIDIYDEMISLSNCPDWIDQVARVTTYPELERFFKMEFR